MARKIQIVAAALCAVAFPSLGIAQSEHSLVGTWKLVSVSSWTDKGDINKAAHGPNPTGFLTYTSEGRMMVVIAEDGRKPLSVADRVSAPVEEKAQAFSTFIAYAGRYTFTGDKVIHHVEVASLQNDVNKNQVRSVKLQGDRLTLRTPPILRGGVLQTLELVWERLKK
jgi:Lipocalin-like domain